MQHIKTSPGISLFTDEGRLSHGGVEGFLLKGRRFVSGADLAV